MRLTVLAGSALLALSSAAAPAMAQRIDTITEPAEVPPASYEAAQYVDSKGCVFVRAGFDGAVIWVPRVSRAGAPVCGYAPSLGERARTATRTVEAPTPVPNPESTPAPAAKPAAPAPAPVRTASARPASAQPMTTVASKPATAPAPVVKAPASKPPAAPAPRVVAQPPSAAAAPSRAPAPAVDPRTRLAAGTCPAGFSGEIISNGRKVRCGPQAAPHVTEVRRGEAPVAGKNVYYSTGGGQGSWQDGKLMVPGGTRILPRHVYEDGPAERTVLPAGYRPAWEDDRLNPHRALQTVAGYYDSQRVWTQSVPRASTAGSRVAPKAPRVRFEGDPALVVAQAPRGAPAMIAAASDSASAADAAVRFIEIGAFTTGDKAAAATRRLRAAGLPVQLLKRGSDEMRRLRVGPFSDGAAANRALAQVHATGYRHATLR